jgi:molybdenum cofactor cytidylyltransferase
MGQPKQLLRHGEQTVLEQTLDNVRRSRVNEIVLVLGSSAQGIRQHLPGATFEGIKVVINENYAEGMAYSLREGLGGVSSDIDAALVVLADQPLTRPETLDRIVDEYLHSNAEIVIPFYKGFRGNPVLLDRSVFAEVMTLEGDIGCRAVFGNHIKGTVKVEVDDVGVLIDIDSKNDYELLQRFGQSRQDEAGLIKEIISQRRGKSGEG